MKIKQCGHSGSKIECYTNVEAGGTQGRCQVVNNKTSPSVDPDNYFLVFGSCIYIILLEEVGNGLINKLEVSIDIHQITIYYDWSSLGLKFNGHQVASEDVYLLVSDFDCKSVNACLRLVIEVEHAYIRYCGHGSVQKSPGRPSKVIEYAPQQRLDNFVLT